MTTQEWSNEIARLEVFFASVNVPTGVIKINNYETQHNLREAINTNLLRAKIDIGNTWFKPALLRLQAIEAYLKSVA